MRWDAVDNGCGRKKEDLCQINFAFAMELTENGRWARGMGEGRSCSHRFVIKKFEMGKMLGTKYFEELAHVDREDRAAAIYYVHKSFVI